MRVVYSIVPGVVEVHHVLAPAGGRGGEVAGVRTDLNNQQICT